MNEADRRRTTGQGAVADAADRAELASMIMGFMLSQAVYVAAKLGIADLLAQGPRTAQELALEANANAEALYRLLRLLAGYGLFVELPERRFENSPRSELLRDEPASFRDFALTFAEDMYPAFAMTLDMVRSGDRAYDAAFGRSYDEHLAEDAEANARFNRFMAAGKPELAALLADGEWGDGQTIVDVGGGNGALLLALLERRPELSGVVIDLPHVAAEAEERVADSCLGERCRVVAASFFDEMPEGDVYLLSHIIHGLDDECALVLLRRIGAAMRPGGHLIVVDGVVAPPNETGGKLMDVLMMAVGGRERSDEEWLALLRAAGFDLKGMRTTAYAPILEGVPATATATAH